MPAPVSALTAGRFAVPDDIVHIADLKPVAGRYGMRVYWVPFCTCGWESSFKWVEAEDARAQAELHVAFAVQQGGLK
jgi:hypothetical protein